MAKHYTKLIIEINENINSIVTAVKGDVASRFLDVQLYSNGTPIDLTSHTVTMSAKSHPDSNFKVPIDKFIDGVITDATNGRCQFELKTDILGQTGVLILQISIFSGQQEVLSTNPFNLYVIDGLRNDEQIEASNEFGALVVLFSEIQNALDDMNAIRENFGEPSQESIEQGILTFWGIIEQMRKDVASAAAYDLPEKVGNPEDTSEENTLFGKTNQVIQSLSELSEKILNFRQASLTGVGKIAYQNSQTFSLSMNSDQYSCVVGKFVAPVNGLYYIEYEYSSDNKTDSNYHAIFFIMSDRNVISKKYNESTSEMLYNKELDFDSLYEVSIGSINPSARYYNSARGSIDPEVLNIEYADDVDNYLEKVGFAQLKSTGFIKYKMSVQLKAGTRCILFGIPYRVSKGESKFRNIKVTYQSLFD